MGTDRIADAAGDWCATSDGRAILGDMAGSAADGVLSMCITLGVRAIETAMTGEVERLVSESGGRIVRHAHTTGTVQVAGRRIAVRRPRVRDRETNREISLDAYGYFTARDRVADAAMRHVTAQGSTRGYARALDPIAQPARGVSKSAVSRHVVTEMSTQHNAFIARCLGGMRLAALMLDGLGVGGQTMVVALGITHDGEKIPLGMADGRTESTAVVAGLLRDLLRRGLDVSRGVLVVIDGGKALAKAVKKVLGSAALIQRCREHKLRNVTDAVPVAMRAELANRLRNAWVDPDYQSARNRLRSIGAELAETHPAAARSLAEGLEQTLTITRLGVQHPLGATVGSTNAIESMIETIREVSRNVKRWTSLEQRRRWTVAGLLEAERHMNTAATPEHLGALVATLENLVRARQLVRRVTGKRLRSSAARPGPARPGTARTPNRASDDARGSVRRSRNVATKRTRDQSVLS